jgi:hypothetical protein
MKKITKELLLGEFEDIFWIDEDISLIIFEEEGIGSFIKEKEDDNLIFKWQINDNGVLAIYPQDNSKNIFFWKLEGMTEKEDGLEINIQAYIKSSVDKKPKKNKSKILKSKLTDPVETTIRQSNIQMIKEIISSYNIWNYSIISFCFLVFFLFNYLILNFIIIIKDFPFLFQTSIILILTILSFRQVFLIANKISYKIRYWIEKS